MFQLCPLHQVLPDSESESNMLYENGNNGNIRKF